MRSKLAHLKPFIGLYVLARHNQLIPAEDLQKVACPFTFTLYYRQLPFRKRRSVLQSPHFIHVQKWYTKARTS